MPSRCPRRENVLAFWGDGGAASVSRGAANSGWSRTINHPQHALSMPTATAGRCDAPSRQFRRHLPRRHASVSQFGQDRPELTGTLYCFGPMSWCQPISAIAAETNAAGFCRRERGLGSCGDHFALMLGNGRENMQRQAGRMRVVNGDELDTGIHQRGNEGQISREAIQLGDDQPRLALAAESQRTLKLRAVIALAGLDFRELCRRRSCAEIATNRRRCASRPRPDRPWRSVETR